MMAALKDILPDTSTILALEPEQLAGYLLEYLNALPAGEHESLNRYNFFLGQEARQFGEEVRRALMEAWMWLERELMLAPKPGTQGEFQFITRRGRKLKGRANVEAFRKANLVPRAQLHPVVVAVWAEFLAGRYDSAVFNALREVEVAVRTAGGFTASDRGDALMRIAFNKDTGSLTDKNAPEAERLALAHLFAGAFGYFRNPTGHRPVGIEPVEAVEIIAFASHLLRIVDERAQKTASIVVETAGLRAPS
jgi:uncharacterized protein (TIGR02391 family)